MSAIKNNKVVQSINVNTNTLNSAQLIELKEACKKNQELSEKNELPLIKHEIVSYLTNDKKPHLKEAQIQKQIEC